jgi:hypothetical protein
MLYMCHCVQRSGLLGVAARKPQRRHVAAVMQALTAALLLMALGADVAHAQLVESIFVSGASSDGYYLANDSKGRLDVALLVDLQDERPITLGARIEVLKVDHPLQTVTYASTASLVVAGRRASGERDEWYLRSFSWIVSCSSDGQAVTFNGEAVGQSPVDFVIEAGVATLDESSREMMLIDDTIAQSSKTRLVCGKYTPLPRVGK